MVYHSRSTGGRVVLRTIQTRNLPVNMNYTLTFFGTLTEEREKKKQGVRV